MMMTKKQTNIQNNTGYSIFHGSERRKGDSDACNWPGVGGARRRSK
jgi:hypothetical protein